MKHHYMRLLSVITCLKIYVSTSDGTLRTETMFLQVPLCVCISVLPPNIGIMRYLVERNIICSSFPFPSSSSLSYTRTLSPFLLHSGAHWFDGAVLSVLQSHYDNFVTVTPIIIAIDCL